MVSCPTSALTFRESVKPEMEALIQGKFGKVSADDLMKLPLFEGVSPKFLQWNEGAVVRRQFKKGDVICREWRVWLQRLPDRTRKGAGSSSALRSRASTTRRTRAAPVSSV